jgi:5-methylcytosine-specific restriction endonuclease McrA
VLVSEFLDRRSPSARHARRETKKEQRVHTPTSGSATKHAFEEQGKNDERVHTPTSGSAANIHEKRDVKVGAGKRVVSSRHVPAAVRDRVFVRDGGQCAFVATNGNRCVARKGLEIDHIVPLAAGGNHEPSNLRLLCAAHNLRAAEQLLGARVMSPFWRTE